MIFSNIAIAESTDSVDSGSYEGRPITEEAEKSGEFYREGNVIVYPNRISSKEKELMERHYKGDISEDEMKQTLKKQSAEFSDIEFQKEILETKDRMQRKNAFSYEHEGFQPAYYIGPSYEGYSKSR